MEEQRTIELIMQQMQAPFAEIKDTLATLTTAIANLTSSQTAADQKLSTSMNALADSLTQKFGDFADALQFTSAEIVAIQKVHVPAVVKHVAKVQTAAAMETLRQDVYNRKRNVMIYGMKGAAYEDEEATEAMVKDSVKVNLQIDMR